MPAPTYSKRQQEIRGLVMSNEQTHKAIVTEWFEKYWSKNVDLSVIAKLGTPDVLVHGPRRGREAVKTMMREFREAFPDLNFWAAGELIAEGDLTGCEFS